MIVQEKIAEITAKDVDVAVQLQRILENNGISTFHFLDTGNVEKIYLFSERTIPPYTAGVTHVKYDFNGRPVDLEKETFE